MNRIVHFELPVDDAERAAAFYRKALGWQVHKWQGPAPYWLVTTGTDSPGIDGALTPRESPEQSTVNTVEVENVDVMILRVEHAGGKVAMPKMVIPGIGYIAYVLDTEGNLLGITQNKPDVA